MFGCRKKYKNFCSTYMAQRNIFSFFKSTPPASTSGAGVSGKAVSRGFYYFFFSSFFFPFFWRALV
jgi:hypothetical protein